MIELKSYGAETNQGPHLLINEDLIEVDLTNKLFVLIDGFGGSHIGDYAARLTSDCILKSFTKISGDPDSTLPFYYNHKYILETNALINSFYLAHQALQKHNDEKKELSMRGGASVIAAAISDNMLSIVSTGNCVLYLLRNNSFTTEVLPDSLSSCTGIKSCGHQYVPLSGIGLFESLNYTARELRVMDGDTLLFCSVGIYASLAESELLNTLLLNKEKELKAIRELFRSANSKGNLDNQSAIVLQF